MADITDEVILKELKNKLSKLLEEEKEAEYTKINRENLISKTKLAIEAFSKSDAKSVNIVNEIKNGFDYPKKGTWHERIIAFMKHYNKAITVSELVKGLKPYESEYEESKLHGAVSNMMTGLIKKGDVKKYKPKGKTMKGVYYTSPQWFNDKDELIEQYKPETKKISLWDKV